jgi:hypothetical protein
MRWVGRPMRAPLALAITITMACTPQALAQRLLLTAAAASIAESCTYPIDMVKTQLQLQSKHGAVHYAATSSLPKAAAGQQPVRLGGWSIAQQLVRLQGLAGLYAGLSPAILRHLFYTCKDRQRTSTAAAVASLMNLQSAPFTCAVWAA